MTKLDQLIERMILNWPSVCGSRWDALRTLYILPGSGFEWHAGEDGAVIAPVYRMAEPEVARASFFADIDQQYASATRDATAERKQDVEDEFALLRLERQFLLEHLGLIVGKRRHHLSGLGTLLDDLTANSNLLTIPNDAEASFRDGALEVIDTVLPMLLMAHNGEDRSVAAFKLIHALTIVRNNILVTQWAGDTP